MGAGADNDAEVAAFGLRVRHGGGCPRAHATTVGLRDTESAPAAGTGEHVQVEDVIQAFGQGETPPWPRLARLVGCVGSEDLVVGDEVDATSRHPPRWSAPGRCGNGQSGGRGLIRRCGECG